MDEVATKNLAILKAHEARAADKTLDDDLERTPMPNRGFYRAEEGRRRPGRTGYSARGMLLSAFATATRQNDSHGSKEAVELCNEHMRGFNGLPALPDTTPVQLEDHGIGRCTLRTVSPGGQASCRDTLIVPSDVTQPQRDTGIRFAETVTSFVTQ
ncbi:MAG: hypothetical protein AAF968_06215 [Pseudomonadota bacterium]